MSRTKQRVLVGSAAFVGLVVAVVLAIVGMPFGNSNPEAFAHSPCTDASCSVQPMHLHIDADVTNGACTTLDATATVAIGTTHQVAVCLQDYTANAVEGFDLYIDNTQDLNFAPDPQGAEEATEGGGGPSCAADLCVSDNPDANEGDSPGGTKLGGLWTCSPFGVVSPRSEVLPIHIACIADISAPDKDLSADPGLLATITFNAVSGGVDTLTFRDITLITMTPPVQSGSCGDVPDDLIGCFGATITKVPDLGITKVAVPATAIAGSDELFNFNLTSNGVVPAGVQVFDDLDNRVVFDPATSDPSCNLIIPPGPPAVEPDGMNVVQCGPFMIPPAGVTIAPGIEVAVPLALAGKTITNGAGIVPGDPNMANDVTFIAVPVAPAAMTITDVAVPNTPKSVADTFDWSVTATSTGLSPASSVVITKTVDDNQCITAADLGLTAGACVISDYVGSTCDTLAGEGHTATCTVTNPVAAPDSVVATIAVRVVDSVGNACTNEAEVCWADPLCATPVPPVGSVTCLPPTVRMEKDIDTDASSIDNDVNLFIKKDGAGGFVPLIIYELVSNPQNDDDGVGAYEFQLKFDHKIFDIEIADTSWLSNADTYPLTPRAVDCSMTIITENDIRWGCVSSGSVAGQKDAGVAAIITVYPEADMYLRLTPGQENGVFRMLLDENCELADVFGDPLRLSNGDLAPGVQPGGTLEVCSDMGITVRILEGDLDLDCVVGLLDEQAIAFRYGAVFGTLYYDPWYDLEPWNKDYDIDIKDLQKVWGRQGSVCDINGVGTIPPQMPLPVPDP